MRKMTDGKPEQMKSKGHDAKRLPALFAAFLFAVLIFTLPARAEEEIVREPLSLTVRYGYDNAAKGGRYLPLEIAVENNLGQGMELTLRIQSTESDGSLYQYDFPESIQAEGTTRVKEYVPLGIRTTQLYVCLVDDDDVVLSEKRVNLNVSWDVPELFIGILSDHPQDLNFLDGVGIGYGLMRTRTFTLSEEDISPDEAGLDQLDVLVVNDYSMRGLGDERISSILDWVYNGGVLLIGTGERADDTLGSLGADLLDEPYDSPSLYHVDLSESYPMEDEDAGMLAIVCINPSLHGGDIVITSDSLGLLSVVNKEQGLIGVAAFDLSEIRSFCEKEPAYVDFLLTSLMGGDRIRELAQVVYSGNSDYYNSIQDLINTGNVEKLPNLALYVALIFLYLLLLGPGLYLFLRHRDLQIYYRRGVILLSLVFVVLVYLAGISTRFRSSFFTYATILDSNDNFVTDTTYVNVRDPYSRTFEVRLDPDYSVQPITRSTQRNAMRQNAGAAGEMEYTVRIERFPEATVLTENRIAAFSPRFYELEKRVSNEGGIGISGEISFFDGSLSGQITSNYPIVLENISVVLYGSLVTIDRMEPGETRELKDLPVLTFPLNGSPAVAEYITGQSGFTDSDIGSAAYLRAMKRASLLQFYMSNYMTGYTADAKVIAFSTETEDTAFLAQEGETYGITMLTSSLPVNAVQEDRVYRSALMKVPTVVTGEYDAKTNSMNGLEPLTLEYQVGTDIWLESLRLEPVSEEFYGDTDERVRNAAFTGNIYFYNHITGNYDEIHDASAVMDSDTLRPYLSPGNILTVRYVFEGTGNLRGIELPMPMVVGRSQ